MKNEVKSEVSMSLSEFLGLIKKKSIAIIAIALVFAVLAFLGTSIFIRPQYEAGAKLIVNTKQDATMSITNDQITTSQKLVDTYSVIIRSRSVLMPVIEKLNLDISYEQLQKCVSASSVDGTQIMQVSVKNRDRDMAQAILKEILEFAPDVIIETVEAGSVKTVEDVYSSKNPVSPNKSLYSALAFLLGAIAAVVFFTVKYLEDDTYKSAEEITQDLDIPVIGIVPRIS